MKVVIGILLVLMAIDPIKIGKINSVKAEARKAYVDGDYKKAAQRYRYLTDTLAVNEDEVKLNLANSYFQMKDTANAMTSYQTLTGSAKPQIRSRAQQQLGVMNNQSGKLEEALANFKQAIKADPNNMDARYNYEILKKKLDEKKKQDQQNRDKQNQEQQQKDQQQDKDQKQKEQEQKDQQKKEQEQKDQQKKDQQKKDQEQKEQEQKDQQEKDKENDEKSKEQKDKEAKEQDSKEQKEEQEKKDRQQQLSQRLQQMKISEEKAKMILEAMKNQEVQYLQQNKRKATKQKDKTKPDW